MNKLINRKVLISMIFIGLTMMGLFSYRYLLMELYPDAEFPSLNVTISTKTELDPKYIESQAAIPVEGVISGLEGVEDITTLVSNRNAVSLFPLPKYKCQICLPEAGRKNQSDHQKYSGRLHHPGQ